MIPVSSSMNMAMASNDTTMYPLVVIRGVLSPFSDSTEDLFISTHNVRMQEIETEQIRNFYPILLNVPNIVQRVKPDTKKFSINSLKLQISNLSTFPQNKRFIDFGSMDNKLIEVYFAASNTNSFSPTEGDALLVYSGYIKSYNYDSSKVTLEAEDGAKGTMQTEIPFISSKLGDKAVKNEDRDKPLPYLFGSLEKAPSYLVKASSLGIASDMDKAVVFEKDNVMNMTADDVMLKYKGNTTAGNNYFPHEATIDNSINIGASTIYIYEDEAYVNLNYYNPNINFPNDDDGRKVPYNSWQIDDNWAQRWSENWNDDVISDDNLGTYIYRIYEGMSNGYYFKTDPNKTGNLVQANLVPITTINTPISVNAFQNKDADTELYSDTDVYATMDVDIGLDVGDGTVSTITDPSEQQITNALANHTFDEFVRIRGRHQIGTYSGVTEHTTHGAGEMGNRPVEVGYTFNFGKMPNIPCKTFVIMRFKEEYLLYNYAGNNIAPFRPPLMVWSNEIQSDSHISSTDPDDPVFTDDESGQIIGEYFDGIRNGLEQQSKAITTIDLGVTNDPTTSTSYQYPTTTAGKIPAKRIFSRDSLKSGFATDHSGSQDFDNCHFGTHNMVQDYTANNNFRRAIQLHPSVKDHSLQGLGDPHNKQAYGGMGFNTMNAFSVLNLGLTYNIFTYNKATGDINPMRPYLFDSEAYDTMVDAKQYIGGHSDKDYEMRLYNFELLHHGIAENFDNKHYFIEASSSRPRAYTQIATEVLNNILSTDTSFSEFERLYTFYNNEDYLYDFSLIEHMTVADFFTTLSKQSNSVIKYDHRNQLSYFNIRKSYDPSSPDMTDYGVSVRTFLDNDIISYKFGRTKKIHTKCLVKYGYDYASEEYLKQTEIYDIASHNSDYDVNFYDQDDDNILEIEAPYIQNEASANSLAEYNMQYYANYHNTTTLVVPLSKAIDLETGDIIGIDQEIDNMSLFGVRYSYNDFMNNTESYKINGQYAYPLWIITKISKNLDKITIEAEQLHHLGNFDTMSWMSRSYSPASGWTSAPILGCTIPTALNYNPEATGYDGSCVYPDQVDDAPVIDLRFFSINPNGTQEQVFQGDIIGQTYVGNYNDLLITNVSYDPDDLQGTGYTEIQQIPNFQNTQTAKLNFRVGMIIFDTTIGSYNASIVASQISLEEPSIGDTWSGDTWGNANLPLLHFTTDVSSIIYDSDNTRWLVPIHQNNLYSYYFYADAYYEDNPAVIVNTEQFQFDFFGALQTIVPNGDINQDGILNILDIVQLINGITQGTLTDTQMLIADINNDGIINILDVVILLNIIVSA